MTNKKMLIEKIKSSGFNVESLAKIIGLSRAGLYKKLNNCSEFKVSEIAKITNALSLSEDEQKKIFFAA